MFIITNIIAYVSYLFTILAFSFTDADTQDSSPWLGTLFRVVSFVNGCCFFVLTVTLLNFGSRLEKIVHEFKEKEKSQLARQ